MSDIKRVIEQVSRDKGIDPDILIGTLEEALKSAAKKKYGSKIDIEVKYNEDSGEIEVFQFREVVEDVADPDLEISLEAGLQLDPECEIGDWLGSKMDTESFGRIAAQSAKQVIIQKIKDAERDAVYANFINRKGEIINGIVQRIDRGQIIVNLGQTEAVLPSREQVPREVYRRGDRIRAYIMDVRNDTHGSQIILSRTHPEFLISLFKTEVPEISEGIVTIMGAAREPGSRGKIAVSSNDSDIDPIGACVGMKGSRVQNVVQELRGEKIDIIPWHVDPAKFVCNALAPAEISRVIIDEENRSMEVIVPDEFLSVAIGKKGQNVRLASKLTRWRLDVQSESRYSKAMKDGYNSLISLPGVGISLADALYENGFFSAEEVAKCTVEDLTRVRILSEEEAVALIEAATVYLEEKAAEADAQEDAVAADDAAEGEAAEGEAVESEAAESEAAESEAAEGEAVEEIPDADDRGSAAVDAADAPAAPDAALAEEEEGLPEPLQAVGGDDPEESAAASEDRGPASNPAAAEDKD
jgi:N utilization substance protein A